MSTHPSPAALKPRALSLLQAGRAAEARPLLEALCQQQVADPEAWCLLGTTYVLLGQHDRGAECCRRALALRPHYAEAHNSLANALASLGRMAEAEAGYREALAQNGRYADARLNLAQVLHHQSRMTEAEAQYREFLRLNPGSAPGHFRLGLTLLGQQRAAEAEAAFRQVLSLKSDFVEAHNNLGVALRALNRPAEAEESYRAALRLRPAYAGALINLGIVQHQQNRPEEAVASLLQALQINQRSAEAHNNLGIVYSALGRFSEALASCQEALRLKPDSAETYNNLFNIYSRLGQLDEALACYREVSRLDPRLVAATYSAYLFKLNYHPDWTPQAIFEEHRRWGETYAPRIEPAPAHVNTREPERRLKIGYVSADFREHPVAFFLEPVLRHHDRARFDIHCYAQVSVPDGATRRLQSLAGHWLPIVGLDDRQAAKRIRDDGIDILVDLGGHTTGNRLDVFALRPAPVQATYIGYPNTTGLPAMDYRITNPLTTPPDTDRYYTETVARLPYPYCIAFRADCPPAAAPPLLATGRVTFGCFNKVAKLAPPVIALWSDILRAVPGARLLLKSQPFDDPGTREMFLARFAVHGIGPERLVLRGAEPFQDYLRSFNDVDIALDPFPYNGGVTTYHALWMGVPVVTLEGKSYVARMGYGVLATLGLDELVAKTPEEYVRIAADLAADPERLQILHGSLRERMRASPLTDGERYMRALEKVYRDIWRKWCVHGRNG